MDINQFKFRDKIFRTITINGELWFYGVDISVGLGFRLKKKVLEMCCTNLKTLSEFFPNKLGNDDDYIIQFIDVCRLVARANSNLADELQNFIFNNIVPSVHEKTTPKPTQPQSNHEKPLIIKACLDDSFKLLDRAIGTHLFSDLEKRQMFLNIQSSYGFPNVIGDGPTQPKIEKEVSTIVEPAPVKNIETIKKTASLPEKIILPEPKPEFEQDPEPELEKDPEPVDKLAEFAKLKNYPKRSYKKRENPYKNQKDRIEAAKKIPSLSHLLVENNSVCKTNTFNQKLLELKIISVLEREVFSKGNNPKKYARKYYSIKDEYSMYGTNIDNPYNNYETIIKWNAQNFGKLVNMVNSLLEKE